MNLFIFYLETQPILLKDSAKIRLSELNKHILLFMNVRILFKSCREQNEFIHFLSQDVAYFIKR